MVLLEYALFRSLRLPNSIVGIIAFLVASAQSLSVPLVCMNSVGEVACKS